jgi:hypothetical protein
MNTAKKTKPTVNKVTASAAIERTIISCPLLIVIFLRWTANNGRLNF